MIKVEDFPLRLVNKFSIRRLSSNYVLFIPVFTTQNFGRREYIRVLRAKREQLARDLSAIPDLRYVEWGRGINMGKFVPKGSGKR